MTPGSTVLRVCRVELLGQGSYALTQQKFVVSPQLNCIPTYGFTFSSPLLQPSIKDDGLNRGNELSLTEAVGNGIFSLLQEASDRKKSQDQCPSCILFQGQSSNVLNTPWRLETVYMSTMAADNARDLDSVKHVLEDTLELPINTSLFDRQTVRATTQPA
ncbi:hypothetical protein DM01DRAFT_1411087 [Hesseltinella vesiculosa]|uniref:Phosphotransferase n=1 Tax=Hesseltinella vesiculosa TaxID=101127 RepID=A0A1X2G4S4_9FUNG|nr:hypothetical protein DM01DRAFT_1411087 [Hesseltinella vesiculosa]